MTYLVKLGVSTAHLAWNHVYPGWGRWIAQPTGSWAGDMLKYDLFRRRSMNVVGCIFAVPLIALYSIDLKKASLLWMCEDNNSFVVFLPWRRHHVAPLYRCFRLAVPLDTSQRGWYANKLVVTFSEYEAFWKQNTLILNEPFTKYSYHISPLITTIWTTPIFQSNLEFDRFITMLLFWNWCQHPSADGFQMWAGWGQTCQSQFGFCPGHRWVLNKRLAPKTF